MAFDRNLVGMYDMACAYSIVVNNRLTAMTSYVPLDYLTMGMYVDQSVGYVVERNYFEDVDTTGTQEVGSIGIWFHGEQVADNRIYDNEFHDLTVGNVAEGKHDTLYVGGTSFITTGLQWLCNVYEGEVFDQFLLSPDGTIKTQQGFNNPTATAGNVFEGLKNCTNQFEPKVFGSHAAPYMVTYHYYSNADSPDNRPECVENEDNSNITLTGNYYNLEHGLVQDVPFDSEAHCANGILDAASQSVEVHMAAYATKYAQLRSVLEACVGQLDNGEKEEVLDAIQADPAWPSHQLRGYLLARSPLSEEAILAAINRTEPMDPWHLSQVLIANSRLSARIWAELDHTGILSPFFYNMVLEHGQDQSVREVLMEELALRSYEKDMEQRLLVLALHEDSTYNGKLDTLLRVLSTDTLGFGRQLAYQMALSHGLTTEAGELEIALADDRRYDQLVGLGQVHKDLGYDWALANAGELATLGTMAASGKQLGRGAAWGIHYALGATDSLPTGVLPEEYRSSLAGNDGTELEPAPLVGAYPNPAKDRLMITYPIAGETGSLEVMDALGRTVLSQSLAGHASFIELDVRGWNDGLYLARVLRDSQVLGETKCAIVR